MPDSPVTNRDVAEALRNTADLMALQGANTFRVNALKRAADQVQDLEIGVADAAHNGNLRDIKGIGKSIAAEIEAMVDTGRMPALDSLAEEIPMGLLEVVRVSGVGPRKARLLWETLDISSLDSLEMAVRDQKLRELKGFTARTEASLATAIRQIRERPPPEDPIGFVLPVVEAVVEGLTVEGGPVVARVSLAGDLREWRATVREPMILVETRNPDTTREVLAGLSQVAAVDDMVHGQCRAVLHAGFELFVVMTEAGGWDESLAILSSDRESTDFISELADRMGPEPVSEQGLARVLGIASMAPEQRHRITRSLHESLTSGSDLVACADLTGELHGHSTHSDGHHSIEQMARAAQDRGYSYWAVTDHGQGHGFGDSLNAARLEEQASEIDGLNARFAEEGLDFRLLKGIEAEIHADGSLGLDDDTLARLDVVVASIHGSLRQDRDTITERCLRAVANPHVDILGHPTSRLLGRRDPSALDMEAVCRACREHGTALEINCNPARLDLGDELARIAARHGCLLVLNCDAHDASHFEFIRYGLGIARRAELKPSQVLNTRPVEEVLGWFNG